MVEQEARERNEEDEGVVSEGERKEDRGELEDADEEEDEENWKEEDEDELDSGVEMDSEFSDE